jgi:acetyl-CoA decarbonylase/synthase complex subunit gamma
MEDLNALHFERIGRKLRVNLLALRCESGDAATFQSLVTAAVETTDFPLILISEDTDILFEAAAGCAQRKPLLYPITKENVQIAAPKLKALGVPAGVRGEGIEEVAAVTSQLREAGIEESVLDPGSKTLLEGIRDQTLIRRAALKKGFRPLGYPTIGFPCFMVADPFEEILGAAALITKYAGIVVVSQTDEAFLFPLLVHRFNIYTDPRRPMTVEEKVYEIGNPDETAPVLISTNYALDFFIVSAAIEEGTVPAYLCIKDTGGIGVLAAWTSGKFTGEAIADYIKKFHIEEKVRHRKIIIPGVAQKLKEELEEEMPGWEIILGPHEGSDIPKFLAERWNA